MRNAIIILILFLLTASCQKKSEPQEALKPSLLDFNALSDKVIAQSHLIPGERVMMIGQPGDFDQLISLLADKISKSGAVYLGTISVDTTSWPETWKTDFTRTTEGKSKEELKALFAGVDLGIMLPGAAASHAPYGAWQEAMKEERKMAVHLHWGGANDLSGTGIPIDTTIAKIYQKVILETNYNRLTQLTQELEASMRRDWMTVLTGEGSSIKFKIENRPVTKQDGDASLAKGGAALNLIDHEIELPAGAIRVAPMEETVEGTISYPDAKWGDQMVEGLVLTFKKGKVVDIKAKSGAEAVKAELDKAGEGGYSFREFALGLNPLLAVSQDNQRLLNFGYGAGVVRLSLGNNEELGGVVRGPYTKVRLFPNATVRFGEVELVKNGKLIKE